MVERYCVAHLQIKRDMALLDMSSAEFCFEAPAVEYDVREYRFHNRQNS